jgi:hypothetical protein
VPVVKILPPTTLAVVVISDVALIALNTLPLKLSPVAFKFAPVTLPTALMVSPTVAAPLIAGISFLKKRQLKLCLRFDVSSVATRCNADGGYDYP